MTFTRIDGKAMNLSEAMVAHGGIEEKFAFASAVIVDPALREQAPAELVAEAMEYLADDRNRVQERKARGFRAAAATADRLFSSAWDPNAHPRDENGRFIDTPDVELSNGAHARAIRQVGDAMVVELDSGTRVNVNAADVREGKPQAPKKPQADKPDAAAPKKPAARPTAKMSETAVADTRDAMNSAKGDLGRSGKAEVAAAERRLDRLEKYGPSGVGGSEETELAAIAATLRGGEGVTAALSGASSLRLKADRGEEMYGERATTRQKNDIAAMRRDADRLDKLADEIDALAGKGPAPADDGSNVDGPPLDRRLQGLRNRGWQLTPGDDGLMGVTREGYSATYDPKTGRFELGTPSETVPAGEIREGDFLPDVNLGFVRVTGNPTHNRESGHLDIPVETGNRRTGFGGRVERLVPDGGRKPRRKPVDGVGGLLRGDHNLPGRPESGRTTPQAVRKPPAVGGSTNDNDTRSVVDRAVGDGEGYVMRDAQGNPMMPVGRLRAGDVLTDGREVATVNNVQGRVTFTDGTNRNYGARVNIGVRENPAHNGKLGREEGTFVEAGDLRPGDVVNMNGTPRTVESVDDAEYPTVKFTDGTSQGSRSTMGSGNGTVKFRRVTAAEGTPEPAPRERPNIVPRATPRTPAPKPEGAEMAKVSTIEAGDSILVGDSMIEVTNVEELPNGRRRLTLSNGDEFALGGGGSMNVRRGTGETASDADAPDYGTILTSEVDERLRAAVRAAKAEGNDSTVIDSDAIIADWGDSLTPAQYRNLDADKAEEALFQRLREIEAEEGLGRPEGGTPEEATNFTTGARVVTPEGRGIVQDQTYTAVIVKLDNGETIRINKTDPRYADITLNDGAAERADIDAELAKLSDADLANALAAARRTRTPSLPMLEDEAARRQRGEGGTDTPDVTPEAEMANAAAEMLLTSGNRAAVVSAAVRESDDTDLEEQLNDSLDSLAEAVRSGDEASIRAARKDAVEILSRAEDDLGGAWGASENLREEIEEAARAGVARVDREGPTLPDGRGRGNGAAELVPGQRGGMAGPGGIAPEGDGNVEFQRADVAASRLKPGDIILDPDGNMHVVQSARPTRRNDQGEYEWEITFENDPGRPLRMPGNETVERALVSGDEAEKMRADIMAEALRRAGGGNAPEGNTDVDPTDADAVKAAIEGLAIGETLTVGGYQVRAWQGQGTSRIYRVRKDDDVTPAPRNDAEWATGEGTSGYTGAQGISSLIAYENSQEGILAAQLEAVRNRGESEGMDEAEVEDLVEDARRDFMHEPGSETVKVQGNRLREGDVLIAPDGTRQTISKVTDNGDPDVVEVSFTDDNPSDPPIPFGREAQVDVVHGATPEPPKPATRGDQWRPLIAQRVTVTTQRSGRGIPPFTGVLEAVNDDGSIDVRGDNTGAVMHLPPERVTDVQLAPDAPETPPTSPHPVGARVKVKHTLIPDTGGIFPGTVSDGTVVSARQDDNGLWDIGVITDNGQRETIRVSGRERNPSITPSTTPRPEFTPLADGTKVKMGNQSGTLEGYDPETGMARVKMDGSANGQVALYNPHQVTAADPPAPPPARRPRQPRSATRAGGTGDGALAQAEIPTVEELMRDQGLDEAAAKKEWQRLYHNARFRIRRERIKREQAEAKVTHLDPVEKPAKAGKTAIRTERSRSANAVLGGIEAANADGSLEDAVDALHDIVGTFRDPEPDGSLADSVIPEAGPLVAAFAGNPEAAQRARDHADRVTSRRLRDPKEQARTDAYADGLRKLADGDAEGLRAFLNEIQRGASQRAFDDVARGIMDAKVGGDGDTPGEAISRVADAVATDGIDQGAVGALAGLLNDLSTGTTPKFRNGYDESLAVKLPPRKAAPPPRVDPDMGFEAQIEALRATLPSGPNIFGRPSETGFGTVRLAAGDGGPTTEALERLDTVKAIGAAIDAEADAHFKRLMAEANLPNPDELEAKEFALRTEQGTLQAELRAKRSSLGAAGQRSLILQGKVEHIEKTWGAANGYEPTPENMRGRSVSRAYGAFTRELSEMRLRDPKKYEELLRIDIDGQQAGMAKVKDALDNYNEKVKRSQAITKEIASFKVGPATIRSKAYRETLARVRGIGPEGNATLRMVGGSASAKKALRWGESFYPTEWLTHAGSVPLNVKRTTKRGHYESYRSAIALSKTTAPTVEGDNDMLYGTAIHELGHHMEKMVPGLAAAEWAFLWQRTSTGSPDDGTRQRDRTSMIRMGEHGWDDDFKNHYTGRDYSGRGGLLQGEMKSYEVFTTGVQDLFAGDGDYLDDDFRRWLLGTMATI